MFTSLYLFKYLNLVKAKDSKHPVIERADFFSVTFSQLIKMRKITLQVINRNDTKCFSPETTKELQTNAKKRH